MTAELYLKHLPENLHCFKFQKIQTFLYFLEDILPFIRITEFNTINDNPSKLNTFLILFKSLKQMERFWRKITFSVVSKINLIYVEI